MWFCSPWITLLFRNIFTIHKPFSDACITTCHRSQQRLLHEVFQILVFSKEHPSSLPRTVKLLPKYSRFIRSAEDIYGSEFLQLWSSQLFSLNVSHCSLIVSYSWLPKFLFAGFYEEWNFKQKLQCYFISESSTKWIFSKGNWLS